MDKNELELTVLLTLFKESNNQRRHEDTLQWQIPTFTVAVISFSLLAYVQLSRLNHARLLRIGLLIFSAIILLFSYFMHEKHRFFQNVSTNYCRELQRLIQKRVKDYWNINQKIPIIYYETFKIKSDIHNKPFTYDISEEDVPTYRAYDLMRYALIVTIIFLGLIVLYEIGTYVLLVDC